MNYFFRGTLEITPPSQVAYAVTDGSQTPYVDDYGNYHQQFKSIKAKIRNLTPDMMPGEEIQDGILQAVAKYKIIPDYITDIGEPYIDPFPMTFGIGYLSGPPEGGMVFYYSVITTVQPGRHIRLIALMDKPQDNYLVLVVSNEIFDTAYYYFASQGVVNQEEDGIYQTPTPITIFRYGLDGDTQIPHLESVLRMPQDNPGLL